MPAIVLYLIKLSCSLGLIWLFYRLVLHNLTFYTLNRWYLLGYAVLAFLMPLINIGPIRGENPALQPVIIQYIPVIGNPVPATTATAVASYTTHWDAWSSLLLLLSLGSCFLLLRFLIRCYSLQQLRRRAELLKKGPINIYRVQESISPFSFGNAIYINAGEHNEKEWEEIILHEYVHIRQRHTLDILFSELLVIVNWYNPFAWLIRYSIRQNLEFIADRAVIDNGFDKKGYQYHLLKVVGQTQYKLANNFNFSSLKKRITMMNKIRSARLHLIRFLFILPLLGILLVAFRDRLPAFRSPDPVFVNAAGIVISLPDRARMPGVTVTEKTTGLTTTTDAKGYYRLCIPVNSDSAHVRLEYSKPGYDGSSTERSWPLLKKITGFCDVGLITDPSAPAKATFMDYPNNLNDLRPEPNYEDAVYNLKLVLQENDQMNSFLATQKAHAEIALWYITEDKQKRILVHTDGTIERYGYSGSPSLAQMEKEYGGLPAFMTRADHPGNSGYLSRWAAISARAEQEFHTTAPGVRSIIFPGDSRVIAIPVSGTPRVYDMDSNAPEERSAFEKLYGPLPACVPSPDRNTAPIAAPLVRSLAGPEIRPHTDTVPRKHDSIDLRRVLWIVDGVEKPRGFNQQDSLNNDDIASLNIYHGEDAERFFGDKGKDGVITVTTKKGQIAMAKLSIVSGGAPLIVVNGSPRETGVRDLDPKHIESITVLQPDAAKAIFGEKAANGAVLIQTKKDAHPQGKPDPQK